MTHIVLVMHEPLGASFAACATHILGESRSLMVFDVKPDRDPAQLAESLAQRITQSVEGPVLLLSDIVGATPFNIAKNALEILRAQGRPCQLLAGANLAMLLKALTATQLDVDALTESVGRTAQRSIMAIQFTDTPQGAGSGSLIQ